MSDYTILCVDDEPFILKSLVRLLRKQPYKLLTAESGAAGLEILEETPVQLVISDQRMPEMSGTEFLKVVKEKYPDTVRIVLSGYSDVNVILESINLGEVYRYLLKPWNYDELILTIGQCIEQYELMLTNREMVETIQRQNEDLKSLNDTLETTVQERTESLQLSQEILAELPRPVICISADREVALANVAARTLSGFKTGLMPGFSIDDIFSAEMVKCIDDFLNHQETETICEIDEQRVSLHLKRLDANNLNRGCMIMIDPMGLTV